MNESEKTALFISPHLDDAVFSCGGTLAKMESSGWRTILCTVFTKSVLNPKGFALACQLDKNLAPDVDYMKLRRDEDRRAAKVLNVSELLHLNFLEAPHRGYYSAPELFAGVKPNDEIHKLIAEHFALIADVHQPAIIFAPQGLGNHCDHLQTIDAVLQIFDPQKINWYFDTPYVIRQSDARRYRRLPKNMSNIRIDISDFLNDKIQACGQYATQIDFQFGGIKKLGETLKKFHSAATPEHSSVENFLASAIAV